MMPAEYAGLWSLTIRRVAQTARSAGLLWLVVIAVLALPWEPWRENGWGRVRPGAVALFVPVAALLMIAFTYHWLREAIGRYRRARLCCERGGWLGVWGTRGRRQAHVGVLRHVASVIEAVLAHARSFSGAQDLGRSYETGSWS